MNVKTIALVVVFATNIRLCSSVKYDGFTLYNVFPTNVDHLKFLQNMMDQKYIDAVFWRKPKLYDNVQFIVNPKHKALFSERTEHFQLKAEVLMKNVQEAFDNQSTKQYFKSSTGSFTWDNYHTVEEIYQWLGNLALRYLSVDLEPIGKSAEGRDIFAVAIKKSRGDKPAVLVEAGIHGNEWVVLEFATYLIKELLNASDTRDSQWIQLTNKYDWYIIPVVNPDGYIYNRKEDRMWKKNRRVIGAGVGVDLNRNFAFSFGKFDSSHIAKDDNYCGPEPFSEPETQALSNFIARKHEKLKFYFAIHSYGQKFILPYSDRVKHLDNFPEMENFAKQAIIKIYQYSSRKYSVGTNYDTLGVLASGDSASWVKKTYSIQYVFTILLRDNGTTGLSLPPEQILPTCKETMVGIIQIMTARPKYIRSNMFSDASMLRTGVVVLLFIAALIN